MRLPWPFRTDRFPVYGPANSFYRLFGFSLLSGSMDDDAEPYG